MEDIRAIYRIFNNLKYEIGNNGVGLSVAFRR